VDTAPTDATLTRRPLDETLQTGRAVAAVTCAPDAVLERRQLPRVLHDAPAAIVLVELSTGCVVQANPVGRELAGDVAFPAPVHDWVVSAELHRPDGRSFPPGSSPLERAAEGLAVHGEPVVLPGEESPRTLWVTGFPVPSAAGAAEQALVVFFDVEGVEVDGLLSPLRPDAEIRDRAVVAAGLSFTISDPSQPDNPLTFVNPAFERTTGYAAAEVQGRNCRLLQGPDTDPAAVDRIRRCLRDEEHCTVTLLNYRKDGTAFWNELSLSPVHDGKGALTHFVGIQADVTSRVLAEQERERHLASERAARAEAERAQRRLALLAEATSMLAATLDVDESLTRLIDLVVPMMADWCTVDLLGQDGEGRRVAASHADPGKAPLLRRLQELQPSGLRETSAICSVLRGGPPVLLREVEDGYLSSMVEDPELLDVYDQLGHRSAIIVPLRARRQVLGALLMVTDDSGRQYDDEDLAMAADLARRAALTVDNARLYQREHDVAEALQRSLLPQLPQVPGLDHAARYLPGSTAAQVGGDWYDLVALPDGAVGLAVGDVMGHDLTAAAAMGQLRSVLQSYAWQGSRPSVVLDRLDQLVQGLAMAQLATCLYGRLDLPTDGSPGRLTLSNAGHLPPVLRSPDGSVRLLDEGVSLLVGAALGTTRDELEELVEPGSLLVLYTDGLVEHRGRDLDEGLAALVQAVADAPSDSADAVCNALLDRLTDGDLEDDVAMLVVRVL
jgi:PAS domain S-box-containing protein